LLDDVRFVIIGQKLAMDTSLQKALKVWHCWDTVAVETLFSLSRCCWLYDVTDVWYCRM